MAVGFAAGNVTGTVIFRATVVMMLCWIIGQGVGAIAQRTIDLGIEEFKQTHPLPSIEPGENAGDDSGSNVEIVEDETVTTPVPEA